MATASPDVSRRQFVLSLGAGLVVGGGGVAAFDEGGELDVIRVGQQEPAADAFDPFVEQAGRPGRCRGGLVVQILRLGKRQRG